MSIRVPTAHLRALSQAALSSLGYTSAEAVVITDVLLFAQVRGNSQGFVKFLSGIPPKSWKCRAPAVVNHAIPDDVAFRVDGGRSFGIVAMETLVSSSIVRCKERGIAIGGMFNTASSTGALGYWADMIARVGYVGIVMSQSPEYVAPFSTKRAMFGTNPIAFGFPRLGQKRSKQLNRVLHVHAYAT
jgi:LDH2 family malate/lactate/ureidoglycolate dehydrogenase